ncbi:MAG: alanine--tRNA ligase [Candidatus Altiarchaeales archaeon]|nr:MAG: alanine--tRNA ligase [Candidatus Altiarchaeales archaeon]HDO82540.1 alanine--tRNA ligase [Candidatus Altiarchaeales archaeon]HEX55189.1 alanine--tRNA ligase [Candidatus Altiarchaeales archaeon]
MSEYEVELFRRENFSRNRCEKCGKFFWSIEKREICGEPPCDEYRFIGNPPTKKALNLHEMREFYLSFFEKNSHKRIKRYPIVARWRNDTFFTIASISCFQPWVLNRTIEPPANPLVISQTCLRFNDIDNVGKTGRHLTLFEMMAHHAFNTNEKFVYFKDRTVELCHNLLLELGIPEEKILYIESEWSGGGNSGPCFEVIVEGVELATLVFMMYEDTPSGKREMDMQVVDTGYGLERFTWLSNATPNLYEAIFGDVLSRLKREVDIEENENVIGEYSRIAGMMNVENSTDLNLLRKKVSERLKIEVDELVRIIEPLENLYAICDHTRALMFMLNDGGIVPSNVKAGYFARLLARRTLRALKYLGLNMRLSEILKLQISYFKRDFPELNENKEDILELCDVEEEKYENTLLRGRKIIAKIENELRNNGIREISLNHLIHLYDSHGLTPDIVREFSNLRVNIPEDFYIRIARMHEQVEVDNEELEIDVGGIEPTTLLYYENQNKRKFKARIIKKVDNFIILDRTCFYPEGGGQEADHGSIDGLDVIDVKKIGNVVLHKISGNLNDVVESQEVNCEIDWGRRLQLMQHHTATHIINGAARRVLGNHSWQAGAHKSENLGRLDITHHSRLKREEIDRIEKLANRIVEENREIEIKFMPRDEAEKIYGFRIYQGGAVPGGEIRIVNIKGWDVEACGGLHLNSTKDVGGIKIINAKRIQDGVIRLEFKAGTALEKYLERRMEIIRMINADLPENELDDIANIFSVDIEKLPDTINRFRSELSLNKKKLHDLEEKIYEISGKRYEFGNKYEDIVIDSAESARKLFRDWKSSQKDLQRLKNELKNLLIREISDKFESGVERNNVKIVKKITSLLSVGELIEIARKSTPTNGLLIIASIDEDTANFVVYSNSNLNSLSIARKISKMVDGNAKGDKSLAIGWCSGKNIGSVIENGLREI